MNRAVVDEDSGHGGVDVEVVVVAAGDGDVPHPSVMVTGDASADDGSDAPVRGAEVIAMLQRAGAPVGILAVWLPPPPRHRAFMFATEC
jgi:hypothetical protein